jgi:hypothetical protein
MIATLAAMLDSLRKEKQHRTPAQLSSASLLRHGLKRGQQPPDYEGTESDISIDDMLKGLRASDKVLVLPIAF